MNTKPLKDFVKSPSIENLNFVIAWMLPRRLVAICAIRVGAHATQGQYGNQVVPELLFMDALKRWE